MARIAFENVSKSFSPAPGRSIRAVHQLTLTIESGELLALLGPSGCGKTTTLRLLAGLETPDAGTISLADRVVNDLAPVERDVAMVFQRPALYPHLTAGENLGFGLRLRGIAREDSRRRVQAMAETLGILDCLDRKPGELSGGQSQRVALGRALVRRPKVLLLDEPFANLDAPLRRELRRELLRLHGEYALTTLLVTHDQAEALALGRRVAVMNSGTIEQTGAPADLRLNPGTPFVAAFLDPSVV